VTAGRAARSRFVDPASPIQSRKEWRGRNWSRVCFGPRLRPATSCDRYRRNSAGSGSTRWRQSRQHTISRTRAAAAFPRVVGGPGSDFIPAAGASWPRACLAGGPQASWLRRWSATGGWRTIPRCFAPHSRHATGPSADRGGATDRGQHVPRLLSRRVDAVRDLVTTPTATSDTQRATPAAFCACWNAVRNDPAASRMARVMLPRLPKRARLSMARNGWATRPCGSQISRHQLNPSSMTRRICSLSMPFKPKRSSVRASAAKSFPVRFRTISTIVLTPTAAPSAFIGIRPVGTSSVMNLCSSDFGVPVA
jgi:hypothetical protein